MSDLKDFIIEDGVLKKYVGEGGNVIIPEGVTKINRNAFYMCENVKSVIVPDGVTNIGSEAFYGCSELQNITIPEGINTIGAGAFSSCFSLESIVIPDSVKKLGNFIFSNSDLRYLCSKKLEVSAWWKNQDIMLPAIMGFLLHHKDFTDKTIIDGYKKHVFSKKKKLLQLIFEDDMVAGVAFYANNGKITAKNFDEEFLLPAQAANATQCIAFLLEWKEKNISEQKKEQPEKGLEEISTTVDLKKIWAFEKKEDGTLCITNYKGEESNIVIPLCIGKNIVTEIGDDAFSVNKPSRTKKQRETLKNIENVIVPDGVINIGDNAFYGCVSLASIVIPNSLISIGCKAFEECKNLVNININKDVAIGSNAFKGCKGLADKDGLVVVCGVVYDYFGKGKYINIPNEVTSIDKCAFRYSEKVININIPESVTNIGDYAFADCESLANITIPQGVTAIGELMFYYCKSLTTVNLPDSIINIGDSAFSGCVSLNNIDVSDNVANIGKEHSKVVTDWLTKKDLLLSGM